MKNKLGRNDLCWCGSGLKFKFCHMDRDKEARISYNELAEHIKKSLHKKFCLVPDELKEQCRGKIIKAHTVSRSSSLKKISTNGKVYRLNIDPHSFEKNKGKFNFVLDGIGTVSTFTGFCEKHDNEIFRVIENIEFVGSKEQCYLLAYRPVAREYFTKNIAVSNLDLMNNLDKGLPVYEQIEVQSFMRAYSEGTKIGFKNSLEHKNKFDQILLSKDYADLRAYIIKFKKVHDILCSSAFFPEHDFQGNHYYNLSNLKRLPDQIAFNSFCSNDNGYIVFSWLKDSDFFCSHFINSLDKIPNERKVNILAKFFFVYSENIILSPSWWDNLDLDMKKYIRNLSFPSVIPWQKSELYWLSDDEKEIVKWEIEYTKYIN